jgi:hypothetical protein
MFLIPADFELQGKGAFDPVVKRSVFAGVDGNVIKISDNAEQGKLVQEGEELIVLQNPTLGAEIERVIGDIQTTHADILGKYKLRNKLKRSSATEEAEAARLESEIAALEEKKIGLKRTLDILQEKQARLRVTSPITGQILTWQVRTMLTNRPVAKGDVLLTVADPTKDWDLELKMPEDRMGHILRAMKEQGTHELDVEYVAMTDPGVTRWGKITEIHSIAEVHGEEGEKDNVVLIRVKINKDELITPPRPGATVTAKIHCGKTSLGYSLFHDLISWFQSRVLFRF